MATGTLQIRPRDVRRGLADWIAGWRIETVFFVILAALVIYLTLVPIGLLVWGSFRDAPPGVVGSFTLAKYVDAFSAGGSRLFSSGLNTLIFALCGSVLAFLLGTYFAWLVERTNIPFKSAIFILMMTPHILPGVLKAYAWLLLLSPNTGTINVFLKWLLGTTQAPLNIYSMQGMIWVFAVDSITLPFLIMIAAFRSMDPSLEEAATAAGSGLLRVFRTVTMPVLLPSVMAGWMLIFIHAMEDFEVPAVIGLPSKIRVFATEIWINSTSVPTDVNLASVYAVVYLIPALLLLWWYTRLTRASEKYATITGKNFRPSRISLGSLRWLVTALSVLVLAAVVVLPFLAIIWASLIPYYQPPSAKAFELVSLQAYSWTLTRDATWDALKNTIWVGVVSTTIVVFLGAMIAWIVLRTNLKGRRLLDFVSFSPIAVSGTLFGLALIWVYLTLPIAIYGTIWILIIGFLAKYLPQSMRFNYAALTQVSRELEEASTASGASWGMTFRRVIVPLIMPGLVAAWIYIIALTFKVLSLPVMLSGIGNRMLSVLIFDLVEESHTKELASLGALLVVLLAFLTLAAWLIGRRFGVRQTE